jgi:hypothetical protein
VGPAEFRLVRIDDHFYREAKAEAAREGVSLRGFLEEGPRLRLEKMPATSAASSTFRIFEATKPELPDGDTIRRIADEDREDHDPANRGLAARPS